MKRILLFTLILSLGAVIFTVFFSSGSISAKNDPAHWAEWRGPHLNGVARGDAPITWDNKKNIKWKVEIPGRGHSTPVIWGDRIFLTTAIQTGTAPPPPPQPEAGPEGRRRRGPGGGAGANIEHKLMVLCLDRKTGKMLWQQTARVATPHEGYHRMYGSFASNSPITDGKYVYAFFGSRGIYAYDMNGKKIWEKDFGVKMQMRLQFGEGVAPAIDKERIFLTFDHEGDSFIVALDKRTGKELWRSARDEQSSWSTPLIVEHAGRPHLVVAATSKVRSYDPATGKVIWECGGLGSNVIPAPVYLNGVFYVMSGHRDPKLMAIQPDKKGNEGDLTDTEAVLWSHTRGISYTLSPVLHDKKLYVVTDSGQVSVFNAVTGEPHYHQVRLPRPYNFKASPVAANGKLYLASEEGDVIILRLGEKFEVIATNTLEDQMFIASPVIADGDLFLRSQDTLFCISDAD
ncbi:MAG TPA: PQQ-binding-like beta-propeller repeat protein [Pyrinomonadaceae bacterium]|nr:PQQ-binding-like beta-propeller repeat protein [Pyrinomonadaceae bacterium]